MGRLASSRSKSVADALSKSGARKADDEGMGGGVARMDSNEQGSNAGMEALMRALLMMRGRDGAFTVKRGEETLTIKARPRAAPRRGP